MKLEQQILKFKTEYEELLDKGNKADKKYSSALFHLLNNPITSREEADDLYWDIEYRHLAEKKDIVNDLKHLAFKVFKFLREYEAGQSP